MHVVSASHPFLPVNRRLGESRLDRAQIRVSSDVGERFTLADPTKAFEAGFSGPSKTCIRYISADHRFLGTVAFTMAEDVQTMKDRSNAGRS